MIVVDVGCYPHGKDVSVEPLIERFTPGLLFGYDPYPLLEEGITHVGETTCLFERTAAWVTTGQLALGVSGIRSSTTIGYPFIEPLSWVDVPCFDLAQRLLAYCEIAKLREREIILKLDCEGAEYTILPHLIDQGADRRLALLLVEWHEDKMKGWEGNAAEITARLNCEVELWG